MQIAFIIAFTYWAIYVIDESFSWQAMVRPIVAGPIVGLVLGDVQTGIIMGGLLEAIYMGVVSIGGGAPADAFGATVICVSFVIHGGLSMEAGLALAFPIGTLTARLAQLVLPMHAALIKVFERYVEEGNVKGYERLQRIYRFAFSRLFHTLTIFFAIWLGADKVANLFAVLPPFVLDGLKVGAGLLPALGLGILTSMIFTKELGAFLIIGFILSAYLNLSTTAVALVAGSIALLIFFADVESKKVNNVPSNELEEDFFK